MAAPIPPVLPVEFCDAVPKAGDKLCDQVRKSLIQVPLLLCRFFSWMMKPDGSVSDEFKLWVGTVTESAEMPPPSNLEASDDLPDKILLTWTGSTLARSYQVWRGETSDTATMVMLVDNITQTTYPDIATPGHVFFYAVKGFDGTKTSVFSNVNSGLRKTGTDTEPGVSDDVIWSNPNEVKEVKVPVGKTAMSVWLWGGGGQGGEFPGTFWYIGTPDPYPRGGGGASSGLAKLANYPVTAGEIWLAAVGHGGGPSLFSKQSDTSKYLRAEPGGNGNGASANADGDPGQPHDPGGSSTLVGTVTYQMGAAGSGFTGGLPPQVTIDTVVYKAGKGGDGAQPLHNNKTPGSSGQDGMAYIKFS